MRVIPSIVEARGIGRADYSVASEKFVEPVISSWQSVFMYRKAINVPAGGSLVTDILVPLNQVVLLYDFFASIPAYRLIRLLVEATDPAGLSIPIVDETKYQTIAMHILKGYAFYQTIRFTAYSYGPMDESMRIGCSGFYTSLEEMFLTIAPSIPSP